MSCIHFCTGEPRKQKIKKTTKEFRSSFENVSDFSGYYLTPQKYKGTSFHQLSTANVHSGKYAHKAWIDGKNSPSTIFTNNNHRAYPTVQLHKNSLGSFKTPCSITFWVWLDIELKQSTTRSEDDWFSFATFTDDESDRWRRTVLVNLNHKGFVHLQHVPNQGKQEHIFQTQTITFPQKQWVELKVYLKFGADGYAKVWQDGQLVSHAQIKNTTNKLAQAHFGLYCSPQLQSGVVYNDDLTIRSVE